MLWRIYSLLPTVFAVLLYGVNAEPKSPGSALESPALAPLINRANTLLSTGQYNDAAKAYSEAIDMSPADYLLYYKRATAYYSLSRHSAALDDFDQVLSLTSNTFEKAHLMQARIHAREGNWTEAREAMKRYTMSVQDDSAQELLFAIGEGELAAKKATQAMRAKLWTACVEAASAALATASHSIELRQQRSICSFAGGDFEDASGDLTRLMHLQKPTTSTLMRNFRISYFLSPYHSDDAQIPALSTLKQCLHYDPDSKECLPAHRLVKAFTKSFKALDKVLAAEDWRGVVALLGGTDGFAAKFEDALDTHTSRQALGLKPMIPFSGGRRVSPRRQAILRAMCRAHTKLGEAKKGERWCNDLLAMDGMGEDMDGLVGRGEALLLQEEWDEAVRTFERAFTASGNSNREILGRLQKAQRLLKQSRQKDYYKVLGVARDADTKTIKKAYRKAVMTAHPDKGGSEAKMASVNEAYEVLSNPELRQRFDNGDDPNDPSAPQGGYGFQGHGQPQHFAHFFQQGGSPFQSFFGRGH